MPNFLNIGKNKDTNTENNKKLTKSISYDDDDDENKNQIENKTTKFAITIVEKKLNVLNGPTNTILLGNKDDEHNSLKITFV